MPIDEQGREYYYTSDKDGVPVINYGAPPAAPEVSTSDQLKQLVAKYNPLMLRKSLQEASGAVAGGMALPVVAPISAGIQNLYNKYIGGNEAKSPSVEELMQKYGQAIQPKTELGREMAEGVGKAFQASKLEGLMGMHPTMARGLEPNDVRVMHGQVKQLAKEIRETPADFQAAQSGLKRQNLYGEDTLGVKAQAAADSLAETLERRKASGLSTVPGLPEVLQPETKMYAVRPAKSQLTRPKMTEASEGFIPEVYGIEDVISDVYGDTPVAKMPSSMVMHEYSKRFLPSQGDLAPVRQAVSQFTDQKIAEMYPDAPDLGSAKKAYNVAFSNREKQTENGMRIVNEFFETPEGQAIKDQYGIPSPAEFLERYGEAERVIKGPFANFISRNVGAEGDALTKLARKGITIETPEQVNELSNFINKGNVAQTRVKAGFPAMGSFHEEHLAKTSELDALNAEIQKLEEVRQPLFEQAHEQGIDPASIPEYAETTNPLRQKLRQREKLQEDIGNIKLAQNIENINDSIVKLKTTEEMLQDIPYEQRQFYPSVTRAQPGEMHYTAKGNFLKDSGFDKLGKDLVEDILTGKAGDTSKLTIENFIRDKHLSRVEAEKAAKAQQQAYRQNLESVLVKRLQDDPSVKTYGNAAVITLTKDTPKDVALRDMSTDTAVLDHCVGQGGNAPSGRKNILTGQQQYYEPIIDPVSGERNKNVRENAETSYVRDLAHGSQLASIRDAKTGLPAATLQFIPASDDGLFNIGYASGAKNGSVDPQYTTAIRDYLNSRADTIKSSGSNLSDNTGVYDIQDSNAWRQVTREAKLSDSQVKALQAQDDLPRFVTVEDVKKATEGFPVETAVAVRNEAPAVRLSENDYQGIVDDYNDALMNAARDALENSNFEDPTRVERGVNNIASSFFDTHANNPQSFLSEPVTRLLRIERALEDRIASLHAQGSEYHGEVADALDNFLIDVRGIRGNVERRLRAAENNAVLERAAQMQEARRAPQAPAVQGDPMPNMSADDLLAAHGRRMTDEQRNWLQNFIQRWDMHAEDTPGMMDRLSDSFQQWRQENTLRPEPGQAVAVPAQGLAAQDPYALAMQYDVPPGMIRAILTEANGPIDRLIELHGQAASGAGRFEMLPENSRRGSERLITNLMNERRQLNAAQDHGVPEGLFDDLEPDDMHPANNAAPQLEAPPAVREATQLMERNPVPREVQTMAQADLQRGMTNADVRRAQEIADQMFRQNTFNEEMPIGAATNMLRNHEAETWRGANNYVREQAARHLEQMYATAQHDGHQVAEALDEIFYQDADNYQAARDAIEGDIQMLRAGGENAWEDLLGPMAEDITWNPTVQQIVIDNLENLVNRYENRIRGYAKGGMVKKARTTPLVASRKSPELAEMAYRYGGMVK